MTSSSIGHLNGRAVYICCCDNFNGDVAALLYLKDLVSTDLPPESQKQLMAEYGVTLADLITTVAISN